jgi:hypothetical protein
MADWYISIVDSSGMPAPAAFCGDEPCDDEPCDDEPCEPEPSDPKPDDPDPDVPDAGGEDGAPEPDSGGVATVLATASLTPAPLLERTLALTNARTAIRVDRRRSVRSTSVIFIVASTPFAMHGHPGSSRRDSVRPPFARVSPVSSGLTEAAAETHSAGEKKTRESVRCSRVALAYRPFVMASRELEFVRRILLEVAAVFGRLAFAARDSIEIVGVEVFAGFGTGIRC